jgi:DNA-binding CsgD family transcriptional regulator
MENQDVFGVEEIARLLRTLGSNPSPNAVVRAAIHGFLAPFVVHRSSLHRRSSHDGNIYTLATYGLSPSASRRFAVIDPNLSLPITDAMRTNQVLFIPGPELPDRYPLLRADFETDPVLTKSNSTAIFVPVILHGEPSAVLGFSCMGSVLHDHRYLMALEVLAASLSLWLQQSDMSWAIPGSVAQIDDAPLLVLSERQRVILLGVERGLTNAEIAAEMGCSRSTVKQELQRVMFSLAATSRDQAVARAREAALLELEPS